MFISNRDHRVSRVLLSALAVLVLASTASAATVVGQSSTSAGSDIWATSGNFSSIYATALASSPGATVEGPSQITQQALANNSHWVISNPTSSAGDLNALVSWVNSGGILLLFVDTTGGAASVAAANNILGAFGPGASGTPLAISSTLLLPTELNGMQLNAVSLAGTDRAVIGPPTNLGGASINLTNPYGVTGGSTLATNLLGNALRVDTYQMGKVYVFGTTFNANNNMGGGGANQQFFLNLLSQNLLGQQPPVGGGGDPSGTPEPGSVVLMSSGLAALLLYARRRKA